MAYQSISDLGKGLEALEATVKALTDNLTGAVKRVAVLETDGSQAHTGTLAILARRLDSLEPEKACLPLADVQAVIQATTATWKELEEACSLLAGKGVLYERKDRPRDGVYSVRFFRPEVPEVPKAEPEAIPEQGT